MRSLIVRVLVVVAASFIVGLHADAQTLPPDFQVTDVPPPEPKKLAASLYDIFVIGDVSPLGTSVSDVDPKDLFGLARSFYSGDETHRANPDEAAFWLKRSIAVAPDDTGQQRAVALARLANLVYRSASPTAHVDARPLFELAAAWNNPDAIWILGQLAEYGDGSDKADLKKARLWYERARKAGSTKAEASLARLKTSP